MDPEESGGFIKPRVRITPPSSSVASPTSRSTLPHPRSKPLRGGSAKESEFIRYLDEHIQQIQRRFAKRGTNFSGATANVDSKHAPGYRNFTEVATDVETLIDLVWVSGTPSLQTPYLLSLALLISDYLAEFPAAPRATFRLLNKVDLAFASLLQGRSIETGESLPGFEKGRSITGTEKVRIKSLVERTRLVVVEVIGGANGTEASVQDDGREQETETETEDEYGVGTEDDVDMDGDESDEEDRGEIDRREMGIARVYDRTMVELGELIGGTPIGIITDD